MATSKLKITNHNRSPIKIGEAVLGSGESIEMTKAEWEAARTFESVRALILAGKLEAEYVYAASSGKCKDAKSDAR